MNVYAKCFDKNNKYISCLLNDKEIFKNIERYGMKLKA